jgi:GNAT superfamily N-acetyltransferase
VVWRFVPTLPVVETVIRDATASDAAVIAGMHVRAWQAAYRGMIADEILDGLSVAGRTFEWGERLRAGAPGGAIPFNLVAEIARQARGFCSVARLDEDAEATIAALYLEPGHLGGGIGRLLLGAALARLHEAGCDDVVVWALEENHPAQAFYARFGFAADGARQQFEGAPEIRMRASLASSDPFRQTHQEL